MQRIAWPGPVSSSTVSPQASASCLEPRGDRAGLHGFLREQVRGAEQHPDLHPLLGQARRSAPRPSRPTGIVDAAREDDVQVVAGFGPRCSAMTSIIASHSAKLARGPTCPPHSCPSKMNRFAPSFRNIRKQAGRRDVQVRRDALRFEFLRLIRSSAGDDRERRLVQSNRFELLGANLVAARTRGCPTPHGRLPSFAFVSFRSCSVSALRRSASARNGRAPPSATASANAAVSLTRVIGPCRIGYFVPCDLASGEPSERCRNRRAVSSCFLARSQIARTIPATVTPCAANAAARNDVLPDQPDAFHGVGRDAFANRVAPCGQFRLRRQIRGAEPFLLPGQFLCGGAVGP